MASLEEILAYKAAEKSAQGDSMQTAGTILGATGGSLLGMMAGIPVHKAGNAVNSIRDSLAARQGLSAPRNPMKALKPGYRMAGGLVGMIVGGGLGNAIAAQAVAENPAAELLAKLQVQGDLDIGEQMALEKLVGSYYKGA